MTSRLNGAAVISGHGVPAAETFPRANSDGTPIYINLSTGVFYYLDDSNDVQTATTFSVIDITTANSPYTPAASNIVLICDATSGNININLLPSADWVGKRLTVKKINAANSVIITPNGTETIDGASSETISTQYGSVDLVTSNGEVWVI